MATKKKQKELNMIDGIASFLDASEVYDPITSKQYVIKEWSVAQLSRLHQTLKTLVSTLIDGGVTMEDFQSGGADDEASIFAKWPVFMDAVIPVMPTLISLSLRVPEEDMEEMDCVFGCQLVAIILKKNVEHIHSFMNRLTQGTTEPVSQKV